LAHELLDWFKRADILSDMAKKLKLPERENRKLRQANEIFFNPLGCFARAQHISQRKVPPPAQAMIACIDDQCRIQGFEPICGVMPIAAWAYFNRQAKRADPLIDRAKWDALLLPEITRHYKRWWWPAPRDTGAVTPAPPAKSISRPRLINTMPERAQTGR
jgi:hypothetical protein